MFIRTLKELEQLGRIKSLVNNTTRSSRFLLAADGMGFSYNDNRVTKGRMLFFGTSITGKPTTSSPARGC